MKKLLLSSVFVTVLFSLEAGNVQAQTCTATPECASLGYTKAKADCPKGALKCPYGNSYFCEKQACQIGDIYYSDNSCSSDVISGKTALGVVVYVDATGIHGQVMSAWSVDVNGISGININMYWGDNHMNIPNLPDYTSAFDASQDFDSCNNTDKIVAFGGANTYPAAWAAKRYAPTNETKGKWCLPAAGILTSVYNNQSVIQVGIRKLGGTLYLSNYTWSSSEFITELVWVSDLNQTLGLSVQNKRDDRYTGKDIAYRVRPVMEF